MKRNFTFLLFLLCSFFVKAQDSAIQVPAGNVSLYKSFAIGERSTPGPMLNTVTANSLFSNVTNFTGQVYVNDGATLANGTTNTIMVVDDITMVTNPTYVINQFRFSVANLNTVAVAARPKVRFYAASTGGPATLLAAVDIAPITFTANRISIYNINLTGTTINLGNKTIFAGLTFDDNAGATGITAAQLNLLGQGLFDPADQGSSEDIFF